MQTIPYNTDEGIIDLVRKYEHDAVVRELNERLTQQQSDMLDTIVQLRAELTSWQSMAERLADSLKGIATLENGDFPSGDDWSDTSIATFHKMNVAIADYESAKSGNQPTNYYAACREKLLEAAKGEQP